PDTRAYNAVHTPLDQLGPIAAAKFRLVCQCETGSPNGHRTGRPFTWILGECMPRSESTIMPAPVFDEPSVTPDPDQFSVEHPSDTQLFNEIKDLLTKDVVGFDKMRGQPDSLCSLQSAFGPKGATVIKEIQKAKRIVFHAGGDSGASAEKNFPHELSVADQVTLDCHSSPAEDRPRFFYHLGDVVYNFAESQYWFDQFYDPFRNYPAPIYAIPGNHDSFIVPGTKPADEPLKIFARNFCAAKPAITR